MITPPPPAIIEVTPLRLPVASSFYAAITQPLGLQYLFSSPPAPAAPSSSPLSSSSATASSLHYGILSAAGPQILFSLVPRALPRPSYITLAAASPQAVTSFHQASVLAHRAADNTLDINPDDAVARARDFDGNMIKAVYTSRASRHVPTPTIHTVASEKDARRVLEWQEDVARSTADSHSEVSAAPRRAPPPAAAQRADSVTLSPVAAPLRLIRRETTVTTEHYRPEDAAPHAAEESGLSTKALIGTVLGAAAGAAFAYAMVSSETPEGTSPVRRASYGDAAPRVMPAPILVERERVVECVPARSYISTRESQHGHDSSPRRPEYMARHTAPAPLMYDLARIEEGTDISRRSSQHGSGSHSGSGGSRRSHSEVGSARYERPLTILPARERSPASSKRGSTRGAQSVAESRVSSGSKRSSRDEGKAATYITARSSHASEMTVKPVPSRHASQHSSHHHSHHSSHHGSQAAGSSTTTIRVKSSPLREEQGHDQDSRISERRSERRSSLSARQVPLPRSVVSGAGYAASVAPSDSVSSVGSKRERERLRERMERQVRVS